MKEIIDIVVKRVISEPGDHTRYDYLVYKEGTDFVFAPCKSTLQFPQRLDYYEVVEIDTIEKAVKYVNDIPSLKYVNPYTLLECCRTIRELKDV